MFARAAKPIALALATALAATAIPLSAAEAGHRGWGKHHHHHHYHHRHRDRGGAAVAAGIIGLAAGAMLGSAMSQPRYYAPPPPRARYYAPSVSYAPEPWTPDWYAYCASKYRSFDVNTGMYLTYRGEWRYCR